MTFKATTAPAVSLRPADSRAGGVLVGWLCVGLTVLALGAAFYTMRGWRQGANWMGPFLSAAANLEPGGKFLIDPSEISVFIDMSREEQDIYHFKRAEHPVEYNLNPIGYAYLIAGAKRLFPFAGDLTAIVLLQMLVHLGLCSWIYFSGSFSPRFKIAFLLLYGLNPVMLGFATFNFYYFWQMVPSFAVLYLWTERRAAIWATLLAALTVGLILAVRPTVVTLVPVFVVLAWRRFGFVTALTCGAAVTAVFFSIYRPSLKNPYHTMYVGLAAYANPYVPELRDSAGYQLYENETGVKLSDAIDSSYNDPNVQRRYIEITKKHYFDVLAKAPGVAIKNAALNVTQAFLLGYQTRQGDVVNYLVAALGLGFAAWLAWRREWFYLVMIPLATATFTLYYPPIRAYMYGAYSLIVFALLHSLRWGGGDATHAGPPANEHVRAQ